MRDKLRLQRREAGEGAVVALGAGTNDDGNNGKPGNICAPMQRPATPQSLPGFQAPVRNPTRTSLLPTSGAGCGGNSKGPCRPGRGRGEGRRHGFSPWGMGNCFAFPLWMKGAGWGWWLRDFCRNTAARAFSTGWQHPHWCCCKEPGRQEVKYALTWGSETARPLLLTRQRASCMPRKHSVKAKTPVPVPVPAPWPCPSILAAGAGGVQYLVKRATQDRHQSFHCRCSVKSVWLKQYPV